MIVIYKVYIYIYIYIYMYIYICKFDIHIFNIYDINMYNFT